MYKILTPFTHSSIGVNRKKGKSYELENLPTGSTYALGMK